jgi:hypothetical protein
LKKRTKKLLDFGVLNPASVRANEQKSFASFLQKRRPSLPAMIPQKHRRVFGGIADIMPNEGGGANGTSRAPRDAPRQPAYIRSNPEATP